MNIKEECNGEYTVEVIQVNGFSLVLSMGIFGPVNISKNTGQKIQ